MRIRDLIELIVLAALWGGSFLFMRIAAPEFGPIPLMTVRVAIAAAGLAAVVAWRRPEWPSRAQGWAILWVGIINSALPFCLLAYAALSVSAGLDAVLNATTALWGALVGRLWLGTQLGPWKIAGLVLGFAGVVILSWHHLTGVAALLPILAGLGAGLSYGIAANYTKAALPGVDPLVTAFGSQLAASLVLAPLGVWLWPGHAIDWAPWASAITMGLLSTALAYILYFRLIAHVGPLRAMTVTFLVPVFALVWGGLLLGEALTLTTTLGGATVLVGAALSMGLIQPRRLGARALAPETAPRSD